MRQFRALGISTEAETIYLELLKRGALTVDELSAGDGSTEAPLAELAAIGLVLHGDGKVMPQPPQLATEALAQRLTREADLARESAVLLSDLWTAGAGQQTHQRLPHHWRLQLHRPRSPRHTEPADALG